MVTGVRGRPASGVVGLLLCATAASSRNWLPRLDVRMTMVLANDTVRPLLSVTRPSSRTLDGGGGKRVAGIRGRLGRNVSKDNNCNIHDLLAKGPSAAV